MARLKQFLQNEDAPKTRILPKVPVTWRDDILSEPVTNPAFAASHE